MLKMTMMKRLKP